MLFSFFIFLSLVVLSSNLILTSFFLFEKKKRALGKMFFLLELCISLWLLSGIILPFLSKKTYLHFWMEFFYLGLIFFIPLFFHFVLLLTSDFTSINKRILQAAYGISGALAVIDLFGLLFKEIIYKGIFYYPQATLIYPIYGLTTLFFIGYGIYLLYEKYRLVQNPFKKTQIYIAFISGCIVCVATLSHILSSLEVKIHSVDFFLYIVFNLIINFATIKYRLTEVNLTMKKEHYYSLASALLTSVFLVGTLSAYLYLDKNLQPFILIGVVIISLSFTPLLKVIEAVMEKYLFKKRVEKDDKIKLLSDVSLFFDKNLLFSSMLKRIVDLIGVEKGAIILMDENKEEYNVEFAIGIEEKPILNAKGGLLEGILKAKRLLSKEEIKISPRFEDIRFQMEEDFDRLESVIGLPLFRKKDLIGILFLGQKISGEQFKDNDFIAINALRDQLSLVLETGLKYDKKKRYFLNTIQALISYDEIKRENKPLTFDGSHSERVSHIASLIGESLCISSNDAENLRLGALLHDIGKCGIDINKHEIFKEYVDRGINLLSSMKLEQMIIDSISYHRERFDGKGYPKGLKGEDIPLSARIIAVADIYDSLISDSSKSKKDVLEELNKKSGSFYDPKIVQSLLLSIDILGKTTNEHK